MLRRTNRNDASRYRRVPGSAALLTSMITFIGHLYLDIMKYNRATNNNFIFS
jgi:hypothetical protein